MNGSTASASASRERDLVVSVNWIGDAIMAMPAVQEFRRRHPDREVVMLARGAIADVWALSPAIDRVIRYDTRPGFYHPLYRTLRAGNFQRAWILPNSFRSAWIPFRAGIPVRIGCAGGYRAPLLTRRIRIDAGNRHQAWEYLQLLVPDFSGATIPAPSLKIPSSDTGKNSDAANRRVIGMIPGAARGPSKRWPADHFVALARMFIRDGYLIQLYGGPDDRALCDGIAGSVGSEIQNLAGRTTMTEWALLMSRCALVVANDSGGMHLAAALGRPVLALYGITDPAKTGPLGRHATVLQNSGRRARDVARDSAEAQKSLASINPETVYQTAQTMLPLFNR